jgi:glycosyltransferase involved in cell wall biosynthesis
MIKLLFCGDIACSTGFGRVNEEILSRLDPAAWEIHVNAINTHGDPHPLQQRFKIYPGSLGGDAMGVGRIRALVEEIQPDLIVIHNDSWIVNHFLEALKDVPTCPIVAWCPPDGANQYLAHAINRVDLLMAPTEWGINTLIDGGYRGPTAVLPYGVDTDLFTPGDRVEARRSLGFEKAAEQGQFDPKLLLEGFIVGRADRNAPRKRYDLTLLAWAEWWKGAGRPEDAWLYLHCSPQDVGWNLPQLASYLGIAPRLIFTGVDLKPGKLGPSDRLLRVYRAWDVHLSTAAGEGWGLVAHESAACRIPQILPHNAAYAEWMKSAAWFMPCSSVSITPKGINTFGTVPDVGTIVKAIDAFYRKVPSTEPYAQLAERRAREPRFSWDVIAAQFEAHMVSVLAGDKKESAA